MTAGTRGLAQEDVKLVRVGQTGLALQERERDMPATEEGEPKTEPNSNWKRQLPPAVSTATTLKMRSVPPSRGSSGRRQENRLVLGAQTWPRHEMQPVVDQ